MLLVRGREVHKGSVANKEKKDEREHGSGTRLIRTPKGHVKCPYYTGVRIKAALRTDKLELNLKRRLRTTHVFK